MALIADIQKSLQYAVSGDKYRYKEDQWDLDLTYITNRVIAMGIPGEGVNSAWRNDIKQVSNFFNTRHSNHYKIINLSGITYDYRLFNNNVSEFGFPDHHPPPLQLYLQCLVEMHKWLQSDPHNVIAVHCLAGRSRTGTIIAGYLIYSSFCANALDAISYFNQMRSLEASDICLPSQIRYVGYMDDLLHDHQRSALVSPQTKVLTKIMVSPPFCLEGSVDKHQATWSPVIQIHEQVLPQNMIYSKSFPAVPMTSGAAVLNLPGIVLSGDFVIKFCHQSSNPAKYLHSCMKVHKAAETAQSLASDLILDIARLSLNSHYIEGDTATFLPNEIDSHKAGPLKLDGKYVPRDVTIVLVFENVKQSKSAASYIPIHSSSLNHVPSSNSSSSSPLTSSSSTPVAVMSSSLPSHSSLTPTTNHLGPNGNNSPGYPLQRQPSPSKADYASIPVKVLPTAAPSAASANPVRVVSPPRFHQQLLVQQQHVMGQVPFSQKRHVNTDIDKNLAILQVALPVHKVIITPVTPPSSGLPPGSYPRKVSDPAKYVFPISPISSKIAVDSTVQNGYHLEPISSSTQQMKKVTSRSNTPLSSSSSKVTAANPHTHQLTPISNSMPSPISPSPQKVYVIPPTGYPPGYIPSPVIPPIPPTSQASTSGKVLGVPPSGYPPGFSPPHSPRGSSKGTPLAQSAHVPSTSPNPYLVQQQKAAGDQHQSHPSYRYSMPPQQSHHDSASPSTTDNPYLQMTILAQQAEASKHGGSHSKNSHPPNTPPTQGLFFPTTSGK